MSPTKLVSEEELAEEYFTTNLAKKRLDKRLEEIAEVLKATTGERQAGNYLVNVSSFSVERIDGDAVKALLGAKTPMKLSASVRLTVVVA